jgi:SAM-dependent methyltransferase
MKKRIAIGDMGNARTYAGSIARRQFSRNVAQGLWSDELNCISLLKDSQRQAVLDLGIGGGRTTAELSQIFENYLGTDYSPTLIDEARKRFPDKRLEVLDARSISFHQEYDCVMFSFNGIDYIDYQSRVEVQKRIYASLRPGGLFIYSSHNMKWGRRITWQNYFWVKEMLSLRGAPRMILNRLKNFPRQYSDPDERYCVVNDPGMSFSLLTIYVDVEREIQALEQLGFVVEYLSDPSFNTPWVYLAARRA